MSQSEFSGCLSSQMAVRRGPGFLIPQQNTPVCPNKLDGIFLLPSREAVIKQYIAEHDNPQYHKVCRSYKFFCVTGLQPDQLIPGLVSEQNIRRDLFSAEYSYCSENEEIANSIFRISGSSSEVSVQIGKDSWVFPGSAPEMKFSCCNTFAIQYRGGFRKEIVEFELIEEKCELKGRILNDSRTSDLADIEYINEELRTLDYSSCIEPPKTLLFRGGIHTPYVIFQRVIGKETIWKDLAQEACLPKECFGRVVSTTFACNSFSHVVHYILPPNHQSGVRHPTIFYVHGGPSFSYDGTFSSVEHLWLQYLSSLGFVAVAVNYRGNQGFGDAYEQAISGDFGGQHIEDIKQLATQIRQLNCVDPQRMHYFGHSFGSYMGGMLLAQHGQFVQQTFKTMILASGVYDWSKNLWGTDPSSFCSPFDRETVEKRAKGWLARIHKVIGKTENGSPVFADPALDKELNRRISPIEQKAFAKSTPVLLIHGDKDKQVSCLCSQQLYERFIDEGVPTDFVIIKDADHAYTGPESSLRFMRNLSSFLSDNKEAL